MHGKRSEGNTGVKRCSYCPILPAEAPTATCNLRKRVHWAGLSKRGFYYACICATPITAAFVHRLIFGFVHIEIGSTIFYFLKNLQSVF